jgi:hypothetical protein
MATGSVLSDLERLRGRATKKLKITSVGRSRDTNVSIVRIRTDDGMRAMARSWSDADISMILHRKITVRIGRDPADFDAISDRAIEANYKYPGRSSAGHWRESTAIWDLLESAGKSICAFGRHTPGAPRLRVEQAAPQRRRGQGWPAPRAKATAFKIRVGNVCGHDRDEWPGRTEAIIPARKAVGERVAALGRRQQLLHACQGHRGRPDSGESRLLPLREARVLGTGWTAEVAAALGFPLRAAKRRPG